MHARVMPQGRSAAADLPACNHVLMQRLPQDRDVVTAIGALDCKVAKLLTKRRNIECTGENYENLDQIAQDLSRTRRLQPTDVISLGPPRHSPTSRSIIG